MIDKKIGVITVPIGVGERGFPLGLNITPLVTNIIARNIGAYNILGINTLDTYKKNRDVFIPQYLRQMQELDIVPDAIWNDRNQLDRIYEVLKILKQLGLLVESKEKVLECKCGKVELLKGVRTREDARLYRMENDEVVCKECGRLHEIEKNVLLMKFPEKIKRPEVPIGVYKKEVSELMNRIEGMEYLVSRTRNTGVNFEGYNIDVDFTFLNFLNTMNFDTSVIVGGNHVNWHLCMATALKYCIHPEAEVIISPTPYIYDRNNNLPAIEDRLKNNPKLKKAFLIASLTWNRSCTNWSMETLDTLSKYSDEELESVLSEIGKEVYEGIPFERRVEKCLKRVKKETIINLRKMNRRMEK